MKLSAAMMETLNAFNGLDPASRSGLFQLGWRAFREKVMEASLKGRR
jgi:hypothetical protein